MSRRLYQLSVLLAGAIVGYLCLVVTFANAAAPAAPSLALKFWPRHALAQARMADALIVADPQLRNFEEPARHARAALAMNPTLAPAARILGLEAFMHGDERRGTRLLQYAAEMSRRDVPTQLWLLEKEVAANNVRGALDHFRIILRVSPASQDTLFPVLTSALDHPDLVGPIAQRAQGEPWAEPFMRYASANAVDPANAAKVVLLLARLGTPPPPDMIQGLMTRLIDARRIVAAAAVYRLVDRRWNAASLVAQLDGDFSRGNDLPPFGWTVNPDLAWRGAPSGGQPDNPALNVRADEPGAMVVAQRMLLLRPGRYRLDGRYRVVRGTGHWTLGARISCGPASPSSASVALTDRATAFGTDLTVPAGCPTPTLQLSLTSDDAGAAIEFWVDDLRLAQESAERVS